jgi:hypothetical protein
MVGFRDLVGTGIAPVSKKTAFKLEACLVCQFGQKISLKCKDQYFAPVILIQHFCFLIY